MTIFVGIQVLEPRVILMIVVAIVAPEDIDFLASGAHVAYDAAEAVPPLIW
jgi:hypothetical protein